MSSELRDLLKHLGFEEQKIALTHDDEFVYANPTEMQGSEFRYPIGHEFPVASIKQRRNGKSIATMIIVDDETGYYRTRSIDEETRNDLNAHDMSYFCFGRGQVEIIHR